MVLIKEKLKTFFIFPSHSVSEKSENNPVLVDVGPYYNQIHYRCLLDV